MSNFVFWQGKKRRVTGVYTAVHEDDETVFNVAREQKGHF
jgi:hypothetical protein